MPSSGNRENSALVSISLVSYGHASFVADLLDDLSRHCPRGIEVILTLNIDEPLRFEAGAFPFSVRLVRNASPRGFAANHYAAIHEQLA